MFTKLRNFLGLKKMARYRYRHVFEEGKPTIVVDVQFWFWYRKHSLYSNHVNRMKAAYIQQLEWMVALKLDIQQAEDQMRRIEKELEKVNHGDPFKDVWSPREADEPNMEEEYRRALKRGPIAGGGNVYPLGTTSRPTTTLYPYGPLANLLERKVVESVGGFRPYQPPKQQQQQGRKGRGGGQQQQQQKGKRPRGIFVGLPDDDDDSDGGSPTV